MKKFAITFNFIFTISLIVVAIVPISITYAINVLTVQDPNVYGSKPGYIDRATLIVEPHGAYVEQSLYLEYSDRGQYSPDKILEVVHRFELPQGSVINDLWLWIGDSVMKAIMKDTWTARAIYDSIVSIKRDPAFLSKKGNQYELHIYPLQAGSYRKIKLNFITPTSWLGEAGTAILPFRFLNANNATQKPLKILFRTQENIWGDPTIIELPGIQFESLIDTLDYHFQCCTINDISSLSGLTLNFETKFDHGYFYRSYQKQDEYSYFQFGFAPGKFFGLTSDTLAHRYLIGLDLSGAYNKNLERLASNLISTVKAATNEKDEINLLVAGAGKVKKFSQDWLPASSSAGLINEFIQSDFAKEIDSNKKPHILYADGNAVICWQFPGIDDLATWEAYGSIQSCVHRFHSADIIAAYKHGLEDRLNDSQLELIVASLDTFFSQGGRLLSFYDYNRVGGEKLASYYIKGLTTRVKIQGDLYRNPEGNIGKFFPESVYHHVINLLEYNPDPQVKIELQDQQGRPAVISKKIKNGLLVVSGIWSFKDDGALRAQLGIPLLGLSGLTQFHQLDELLDEMNQIYLESPYDRALVFSNADSLIPADGAINFVSAYLDKFSVSIPKFKTVNLLDGITFQPPYISEDGVDYYGSGYLLKKLADLTSGLHFETHLFNWDFIAAALNPNSIAPIEHLDFSVIVDNGSGKMIEQREVSPNWNDGNKPVFIIGSATGKESFEFQINTKIKGIDSSLMKQKLLSISPGSERSGEILPAMLAFENLKDLFAQSGYDTAAIIKLAIRYNLLCDYTALIALEPNDTLHFMRNPFDESNFYSDVNIIEMENDSLEIDVFPNPFNKWVAIVINLPIRSRLELAIYNIQGQLVNKLVTTELVSGRKTFLWDGLNSDGAAVSSGLYFARAKIRSLWDGQETTKIKRILLIR